MEFRQISQLNHTDLIRGKGPLSPPPGKDGSFRTLLGESSAAGPPMVAQPAQVPPPFEADPILHSLASPSMSRNSAVAAYRKHIESTVPTGQLSDVEKYKDDQLLLHPGGDHYDLEQRQVIREPQDQKFFWGRIGKDISDAFGNMKNFFHDLLFGAKILYRDEEGRIQESKRQGLVGSVVDFFHDLGSALSFGTWRPDGEPEPEGFLKRAGFFFSKMKEALFGDIVQGVCGSVIHLGKDLLFACWNTLEVIPDATVGNLEAGRKATTAVFDNGQVMLDYMTDILPFGDAWVRVHSLDLKNLKAPVLQNLERPEHSTDDDRWRHVRNTPFRKTIETIGSLLMDVLTLKMLGRTDFFSHERRG